MKRSSKLIALLCSLAMVFTLFANITIVSANSQGVELLVDETSTDTVKVVKAKYVGMDAGIASFTLKFDLPEGATAKTTSDVGAPVEDLKGTTYTVGAMSATNVVAEDGVFATIEITLAAALTEDFTVTLLGGTLLSDEDANEYSINGGNLSTTDAVFVAPEAPATPIPDDQPITEGQGVELSVDASSTDTVKVIKAKYVGMDAGIASFTLKFDLPEGATAKTTSDVGAPVEDLKGTTYTVGAMSAVNVVKEDGVFATIEITLASELAEDFVVTLLGGTLLSDEDANEYSINGGNLKTTYAVLRAPEAPSTDAPSTDAPSTDAPSTDAPATEAPEATVAPSANPRPTPIVEATEVPVETEIPAETATPIPDDQPITEGQGIELSVDESSTDTVKVIKAKYVGMDAGIASFTLKFDLPEGATAKTTSDVGAPVEDLKGTTYTVGAMSAVNVVKEDGVFATIEVTLASELAEDFVVTLLGGTLLSDEDANEYSINGGNLKTTYAVLRAPEAPEATEAPTTEPTAEPTAEPEAIVEVALSDLVDASKASTEAGTPEAPSNSYVTIITDGVYGTDYVAKDADGNVLTEAEFINKISGYNGSVADAINGITLVVYTEGTEITANLNDATTGTIVDSGSVTATTATPEPDDDDKDDKPGIDWEKSSVTVKPNKSVEVELEINNLEYTDEDIDFEITSGEKYLDDVDFEVDEDGKVIFTIEAGKKTGQAKIKAIVTVDGEKYTDTLTVKVSSGSSSGSGSGTGTGSSSVGTIAGTQTGTTGGTLVRPDANVVVNFTDLGQAAWAADAINYLAARGIVNGRSATTFDPNADITRAEFAKLVMTVYGLTPPADAFTTSRYTDVAAGSWYLPYIEAASNLGVLTGYPDGSFRPNALVSRQEMAVMMYRATQMKQTVLPTVKEATAWSDAALIGDWAAEAVTALNVAGVMNGTSATTFEPTASATRAQAAQMIYNLYQVAQ